MPKYHYRCKACLDEFLIRHSIKEKKEDCEKCESSNTLIRLPSSPIVIKKTTAGKIVKKHIEDAKQDIAQEKEEMQKEHNT